MPLKILSAKLQTDKETGCISYMMQCREIEGQKHILLNKIKKGTEIKQEFGLNWKTPTKHTPLTLYIDIYIYI